MRVFAFCPPRKLLFCLTAAQLLEQAKRLLGKPASQGRCSPCASQMALISSQLQWLEAELESAVDECGQVVEQNNAWLAETIQKNTKNLQYQTCARPLGRGGGG